MSAPVPSAVERPRPGRRLLWSAVVRVSVTTVVLFGLFFSLPFDRVTETSVVWILLGGGVVFVVVMVLQVRAILRSPHPRIRAGEAVAVALPLVVIVFASAYLSMAGVDPANFSQPLDHVGALYFTVTVLGTVGFGDIVAVTAPARIAVTVQMLIDLVLIGLIARLLFGAARYRAAQQSGAGEPPPGTDDP